MAETESPSNDRLTDVPGVAVGHWTDPVARTGCTAIILPEGTVGSGEVRGGGPASREFALLDPLRKVTHVDAVVLTGGSAFGLAAADGVVAHLESIGRGHPTPAARVPIVPALAVYDLLVGDASVRPDRAAGLAAAQAATDDDRAIGPVGAGTGCTVDKWLGAGRARPSGLVSASARVGDAVVAVLAAVNAVGSVGVDSRVEALDIEAPGSGMHTTIGVVATSARLDKVGCHQLAQGAHHGLARAIFPSHTGFDGDAFVAVATGGATGPIVDVDTLKIATVAVVERAIRTLAAPTR